MEKNFLLNVKAVFISIRLDIRHPANLELLHLVRKHFMGEGKNISFLNDVKQSEILRGYIFYGIIQSEQSSTITTDVDPNFIKLYNYALDRAILSLQENSFDEAYDIIDAFHWLPESIANEWEIDYATLFASSTKQLSKWPSFFSDLPNENIQAFSEQRMSE